MLGLLSITVLGGIIYVITRSKMNLDTGVSLPEEEIDRTSNKIKARLIAKRLISHEKSGETTTFAQSGETSVWLTDSKDPIYDTVVVTVQPADDEV